MCRQGYSVTSKDQPCGQNTFNMFKDLIIKCVAISTIWSVLADNLVHYCTCTTYSPIRLLVVVEQVKNSAMTEITDRQTKIMELQAESAKVDAFITEIDARINAATQEKEDQMNSDFKLLSEKVDKLSKELVKVGSAASNQKDTVEVERAAVAKVKHPIRRDSNWHDMRDKGTVLTCWVEHPDVFRINVSETVVLSRRHILMKGLLCLLSCNCDAVIDAKHIA